MENGSSQEGIVKRLPSRIIVAIGGMAFALVDVQIAPAPEPTEIAEIYYDKITADGGCLDGTAYDTNNAIPKFPENSIGLDRYSAGPTTAESTIVITPNNGEYEEILLVEVDDYDGQISGINNFSNGLLGFYQC